MKQMELFAGIGGFGLAGEWAGIESAVQVEWNLFCQKVLSKNFPNAQRFGDITKFDGTPFRGAIDIISGGFPCQPYSTAGKRLGKEDERHLWPEMLRVIREVAPRSVVGEVMRSEEILPGSQLNPRFVEEMMGFPIGWTELPL